MRDSIYSLVRRGHSGERASQAYDVFIMAVAFLSIVPLLFKQQTPLLDTIDLVTVYILFADYVLRWISADKLLGRPAPWAFLLYPVTPLALVELVSLLPSLGLLPHSLRILRMLRIFNLLHYSKSLSYVVRVFKSERRTLVSVLMIALVYIFVSALAMFSYEPDTFDNFFHALYWATTALTTVGYGDIYPTTEIGRLISMVSALFGTAVIALPASIITADFVTFIKEGEQAENAPSASEYLIAKGEREEGGGSDGKA